VQNEEDHDLSYPAKIRVLSLIERAQQVDARRTPAISQRKRHARLIFGKAQNEFQDAAKVRRVRSI